MMTIFLLLASLLLGGSIALVLVGRPFLTFCLYVAVLSSVPLVRIYLAQSIPLYLSDLLLGLVLAGLIWRNRRNNLPGARWPSSPGGRSSRLIHLGLIEFTIAVLFSSTILWMTSGVFIEVCYAVARFLLSTVGVFYAVTRLTPTLERQILLSRILLFGALANAIVAVLQTLPATRVIGVEIPLFLYGNRTIRSEWYELAFTEQAVRGFGFHQAATTLGGYLGIALILCMTSGHLLFRRTIFKYGLPLILLTGLLATYSRHALLSLLILGVVALVLLPDARAMLRLTVTMLVIGTFVLASGIVDVGFLKARSEVVLEDQNTAARAEGHVRYYDFVFEHPVRAIVGNGIGWKDLHDRGVLPSMLLSTFESGFVSDAYLLVVYNLGIAGFLFYIALFAYIIFLGLRQLRCGHQHPGVALLSGLTTTLLLAAILHPFDNYFFEINEIRNIFWLLLGLTTSVIGLSDKPCAVY